MYDPEGLDSTCRSSLVQADWLRSHLTDGGLVILDVTQRLDRATKTVAPEEETFLAARIPGAKFADVGGRLSQPEVRNAHGDLLHNMRPTAAAFAAGLALLGVEDDVRTLVVLYSSGHVMWATRAWWLLHSYGFGGRVSVLDGGLQAWVALGCDIESGAPSARADTILDRSHRPPHTRRWRPGAFVGKERVLQAVGDAEVALVDSLQPESFSGAKPSLYGRRGHIESAVNVPYMCVVDQASGQFLSPGEIRDAFAAVGLLPTQDSRSWILY